MARKRDRGDDFVHGRYNVRGDETDETPKGTTEVMYVIGALS
jgi:hypothetical protein